MKKLSMSLLFIIMMILLISAVSAAEINENEDSALSQEDSTVLEVDNAVDDDVVASDTSEVLADSGDNFTALQQLITAGGTGAYMYVSTG